MRTRCANCGTVFRITPAQLRARNGLVRCGQCQGIFNAFDSLIEEAVVVGPEAPPAAPSAKPSDPPSRLEEPRTDAEQSEVKAEGPLPEPEELPVQPRLDPIDAALVDETPEESARAAREAGLAAVRELSETPGYSRWATSPIGTGSGVDYAAEPGRRAAWPLVVGIVFLVIALAGQLLYFFRTELVLQLPGLHGVYDSLGIDVPLPRHVDLVSIEASDLQSDNARGLLILQATLKNRAAFSQAWPALELTLTDAADAVVSRRVLKPEEYLPTSANAAAFSGNSEIGLKLWIESKQQASGYRLYVFYP